MQRNPSRRSPVALMLVVVGASALLAGCGDQGAHLPAGMTGSAGYANTGSVDVVDSVLGTDPGPSAAAGIGMAEDPILAGYDGIASMGDGSGDMWGSALNDWDSSEGSLATVGLDSGLDDFGGDAGYGGGYGYGSGYGYGNGYDNGMSGLSLAGYGGVNSLGGLGGYGSAGGYGGFDDFGSAGMGGVVDDPDLLDAGFSDPGLMDAGMDAGFDPGFADTGFDPGFSDVGAASIDTGGFSGGFDVGAASIDTGGFDGGFSGGVVDVSGPSAIF